MKTEDIIAPGDLLAIALDTYSKSPHTTRGGRILRLIAPLIPVKVLFKLLVEKNRVRK
jgi:hypothetical protein